VCIPPDSVVWAGLVLTLLMGNHPNSTTATGLDKRSSS